MTARLACARGRREVSVLSHAVRVHRGDGAEKAHQVRPMLLLPDVGDTERERLVVAPVEVRDDEFRACAAAEDVQRKDLRGVLLRRKSAIAFKVGA